MVESEPTLPGQAARRDALGVAIQNTG